MLGLFMLLKLGGRRRVQVGADHCLGQQASAPACFGQIRAIALKMF
jgi:predicted secreted protein